MNLKNEFAKWFSSKTPQSYKQWFGKNLDEKLSDIDKAYKASFQKSLFDINFDNIEDEISKMKRNIKNRHDVKDKTFAEYDKKMCSGIPKAIINNYYIEFLENYDNKNTEGEDNESDTEEGISITSFSYEKDLKKSLISQAEELFPGYKILGDEYPIKGRIDVLLESKNENKLLVVKLKAGLADLKVCGQIMMFIGPLMQKYRDKEILGIIIAGEIDESLKMAVSATKNIKIMTYKTKLLLEEMRLCNSYEK
jgi:hypothetical protein